MYKYILPILISSFLTLHLSAASSLSKEELKKVKSQLKEYAKDPASFKKMMDRNKETLDSNAAEISQRRSTINQLSNRQGELQKRVSDLESQIAECQNKPVPKCPECPMPGATPSSGTFYKVQLGMFKKPEINSYFAEPRYIGVEKGENGNRFVVSYFSDKKDAESFSAEMKRLGIKGAFVSTYSNGERTTATPKAKKKSTSKKKK